MKNDEFTACVEGRYIWKLVDEIDNRNNTERIVVKKRFKNRLSVNTKSFLSSVVKVTSSYKADMEANLSLKLVSADAVGGGKISYSYHYEVAQEITNSTENGKEIVVEEEVEREYAVGGGCSLNIYQLCYIMDSTFYETQAFFAGEKPSDVPNVILNFNLTTRVLGLGRFQDVLANTRPTKDNTAEWTRIRECIIKNSASNEQQAFFQLLHTLRGISPSRDNVAEWAAIRTTCNEIISQWPSHDKQALFIKLLTRFSMTMPTRSNVAEWARIREVSDAILSGIVKLF